MQLDTDMKATKPGHLTLTKFNFVKDNGLGEKS